MTIRLKCFPDSLIIVMIFVIIIIVIIIVVILVITVVILTLALQFFSAKCAQFPLAFTE